MKKFIPYEKLSKKQQKILNRQKRTTWGCLSPVTRKPQNSKAYSRAGTKHWKDDFPELRPCFLF